MSLQLSAYIAQSLDGYIAREDGNLDWLDAYNAIIPKSEDLGYTVFMASVDVLLMGRNTYEKVLSFGDWPYKDKRVIVLSTHALKIPQSISNYVSHSNESPEVIYKRLEGEGVKKIYVDGANTIQQFLSVALLDEIIITIIPTLLGSGISLFGELKEDIQLKLINATSYDFGLCQLSYQIEK